MEPEDKFLHVCSYVLKTVTKQHLVLHLPFHHDYSKGTKSIGKVHFHVSKCLHDNSIFYTQLQPVVLMLFAKDSDQQLHSEMFEQFGSHMGCFEISLVMI